VGVIGLSLSLTEPLFRLLVPFNILLSVALVIIFHSTPDRRFWLFFIFSALAGWCIEWAGVSTGKIFGVYGYGETLGFKIAGVPPLIGINWFMLAYCTGTLVGRNGNHWLLQSLPGALLMVGYDLLLEPSAIRFGFWWWENGTIPLQNYLAWFAVSFLFVSAFIHTFPQNRNRVAPALFWAQVTFFAILWLRYKILP
jgi:putative membrane protein